MQQKHKPTRWLALYDGSPDSQLALDHCFKYSRDGDWIVILRALEWQASLTEIKQHQHKLNQLKDEMLEKVKPKTLTVEANLLVSSKVKRKLCNKVTLLGVDIVVMGSRGMGEFKGVLLGSVSKHVIEKATCSVLVVHSNKPKNTEEKEELPKRKRTLSGKKDNKVELTEEEKGGEQKEEKKKKKKKEKKENEEGKEKEEKHEEKKDKSEEGGKKKKKKEKKEKEEKHEEKKEEN